MAEAIAKQAAGDIIEPSSAGLVPFGEIPASTVTVLSEHGFSTDGQFSKALSADALRAADLLINMTGRPGNSLLSKAGLKSEIENDARPMPQIEDWDVGDPYGYDLAVYRAIRDEIERRMDQLAQRLRAHASSGQTA